MTPSRLRWCWKLGLASALAMGGASADGSALAQPIPDATLGAESSVVTPTTINGIPSDKIDGGAQRGANLFHSFREFNVDAGRGAYFANPAGILNIISRVTGSNPSNIMGKLGVSGNANLFLINPNGIIFGPNASLNVAGSFLASTASSLKFADGTEFSATAPQTTPLLTISVPIGLQFGGAAAGISVNGSGLAVQPGKTLALLGGDVMLSGGDLAASGGQNLEAPGGRIELGSVAENSLVNLSATDFGWNLGYGGVQNFKDIQFYQGAYVDASGEGGDVQVQGRRVTIQDGAAIAANTQGSEPAGELLVRASDLVELSGTTPDGQFPSALTAGVLQGATGNGGNLRIETGQLLIRDGAQAITSTGGAGKGGNLIVKASDSVTLIGTTTNGNASSGLYAQSEQQATGNGGDLTIETGRLIAKDGGQVSTATFSVNGGQGGTLNIKALDSIQLSGTSPTATENRGSSGLFVSAEENATGNGGDLIITTGQLTVQDAARISADSLGSAQAQGGTATLNVKQLIIRDGGQVRAGSFGQGPGGSLSVNASDSVQVSGTGKFGPSNLFTQAQVAGSAGNLNIRTGSLNVRNGGQVTVGSEGSGKAGDLFVQARSIGLDDRGKLSAETTTSGNGGNITLQLQDLLLLRHGSQISTTGSNNGGNITIDPALIVAVPSENSDITANAQESFGGRVSINAQGIFGTQSRQQNTPESDITATSARGPQFSGIVQINTPIVDPSRGLVVLPAAVVNASGLIAQGCPAGDGTTGSQFTVTGRGGLPPNPGESLSSDAIWEDARLPATTAKEHRSATVTPPQPSPTAAVPLVPAQGWVFNGKGEVTLTASAPTEPLQIPWLTPSGCVAKTAGLQK